jgi:uncharacterized protein YqgV (UPF0045/DUF77 family)
VKLNRERKLKTKLNIAVQVLPEARKDEAYRIVDLCIGLISSSGLKYKVCPFETVIEGYWDEIIHLVNEMKELCFESGCENVLINLKIQANKHKDVSIEDKTGKYENPSGIENPEEKK